MLSEIASFVEPVLCRIIGFLYSCTAPWNFSDYKLALSKERSSNLNLTIAGGSSANKTELKATISLPVKIGRNLRSRFSYDSEFRDCSQEVMQSDSQIEKGDKQYREKAGNVGLENSEVRDPGTLPDKIDSLMMVSF
ncbi:hypothetical protein L3X38_039981 [Prunus dulcis]|uniref:Uncharacterized protein n=1 Tax=Prunus dulcis TaxID=3755 RepID=A0AAD4YTM8_PRUDU|nr:hypothetical protein L3X38_039981 [Prunus dulcis]